MPLYDCVCSSGHKFERVIPLAQFEEPIICACGVAAHRAISLPTIVGGRLDYEYACPITGKHVVSKRQHEENLKVHGCRVMESGEREYNQRRNADLERDFERKVDETIEREIAVMPSEKREMLAKELMAGTTVEVARG